MKYRKKSDTKQQFNLMRKNGKQQSNKKRDIKVQIEKIFQGPIRKCNAFYKKLSTLFILLTCKYNVILRIASLLETKENIKIESHPFYHIICDWFLLGWSKKQKNLKKRIQNGRLKKTEFIEIVNSQKKIVKIS